MSPSVSITVRRARPDDAERLGLIHVRAWRAAYEGLLPASFLAELDPAVRAERWRGVLERESQVPDGEPAWVTHVAVRAGETVGGTGDVVGFIGTGPASPSAEAGVAEGDPTGELFMNVDPSAWRIGAGRALMTAALERMRAVGLTDAMLWLLEGNERAAAFYEATGWQAAGVRKVDLIGAGTGSAEAPHLLYRRSLR